jgi:hypothetical protein
MLVIRWTPPLDLCFSAAPLELRTVMAQIRAVATGKADSVAIQTDSTADSRPYLRCLELFTVERGRGPTKVSVEGTAVNVAGSGGHLEVFASYFDFADDHPSGFHTHFEYFDGNAWIAADSISLVVMVR